LLALTTGSYLVVHFSSFWNLPSVIHIARKVSKPDGDGSEEWSFAAMVLEAEAVAQVRT
jgi:hypothetical protein